MNVLFVFIVLQHRRCQELHFKVTEHLTAACTSQQIFEAFLDRDAPQYLMRDRDSSYGGEVRLRISSMGIEDYSPRPRRPWQNLYVERLIGSIRRDCVERIWFRYTRHDSFSMTWLSSRGHIRLVCVVFGAIQ